MTCRELIAFLDRYLADELPDDVRIRFMRHLDVCPACVRYLDSYRRTVALVHAAWPADDPVPVDVPRELLEAVRAAMPVEGEGRPC